MSSPETQSAADKDQPISNLRFPSLTLSQRLRMKFVALSGGSLILVLTLIIGMAEISSFTELTDTADHTLILMADNGGTFPSDALAYELYDEQLTKETPYESRWFSVLVRADGQGEFVIDTAKTATIDEKTARVYANDALKQESEFGFVSAFRFIRRSVPDGEFLIFLDRGRQLTAFYNNLAVTISIACIGVTMVLVLLSLASGIVIKPFVESHMKQKEFITNAGHDIKTPLSIISLDADVLASDIGDDNEWIADIKRQVHILTNLTNDLVFLSQMEEDQRSATMMTFSMSELVTSSVDSFRSATKAEGKVLTSTIDSDVIVFADEKMIRQLLSVLLDNALKYSDDGGNINVSLTHAKSAAVLEVSNTAPMGSLEHVDRWFDRFYQGDKSRTHSRQGFGIGLSVAQAVVTANGGRIQASVRDGNTLVMTVTLG